MKHALPSRLIQRLKIIEGQVRGLQRMIESGTYCIDVITQAEAVKNAVTGVVDSIMENHLATHVAEQMVSGKRKQAVNEIMKVYKLAKN
jgi:CsoR family transcriptional regulator, copper-sensing transcriptional repressor